VPQGSVLGPFLFLVSVNDLATNILAQSVMFADDVTIFSTHKSIVNTKLNMSRAVEEATEWFGANKFLLNPSKTQCIHFALNNNIENCITSTKLLGFHLDVKLNWGDHIDELCKRLSRVIYVLRHIKNCVPPSFLRNVYFALFHSHLLYGTQLWGHAHGVDKILILQKKAVRIISSSAASEPCRPLFRQLYIPTVVNIFILESLMYVKENLASLVLNSQIHSHNTRAKDQIHIKYVRLSHTRSTYKSVGISLFNLLDSSARHVPTSTFSNTLRDWLLQNPFYRLNEALEADMNLISF